MGKQKSVPADESEQKNFVKKARTAFIDFEPGVMPKAPFIALEAGLHGSVGVLVRGGKVATCDTRYF